MFERIEIILDMYWRTFLDGTTKKWISRDRCLQYRNSVIAPCHYATCLLTDSLAFGEDTALATAPAGFGEETA